MNFDVLMESAKIFLKKNTLNYITEEDALRPDLIGMKIYEEPLFGVAAADSPLFVQFRTPGVVHPEAFLPADWLEGAKSVISFFLPFTDAVKRSNAPHSPTLSPTWCPKQTPCWTM